jgi:hypothetical protein
MLPKDIINLILEYDGRIKYRNGKYIDQINIQDEKYTLIKKKIVYKLFLIKKIETNILINRLFNDLFNINIHGFFISFPIHISTNNTEYGLAHSNVNFGQTNHYTITFYKNISNTFWYKIKNYIYKIFYSDSEIKWYFTDKYRYN